MPYFVRRGVRYWVGVHRSLGLVVFDPGAQGPVVTNRVRLYVCRERRMATFSTEMVRPRVRADGSGLDFAAALGEYLRLQAPARLAVCFRCRQDINNVDHEACPTCGWIRCPCGACGCAYEGEARQGYDRSGPERRPEQPDEPWEPDPGVPPPATLPEAIVQCVRSLPGRISRTGVARILIGSTSRWASRHQAHRLYGRFADLRRCVVMAEVSQVIRSGALRLEGRRLFPAEPRRT